MSSEKNYALQFIPGAFALAIAPQGYALVRMMLATGGQWSNVAPRQNWEALKAKTPHEIFQRCIRANGAHINALESMPLFSAAMLAGVALKVPASDMNRVGLEYLGVRVLYTALYVGTRGEAMSYLRTGVWAWSIALPAWTLFKCAQALNAE